jgi:hypothetical protein
MKPRSINNFLSNDRFFKEKSDTPPFRAKLDTQKIWIDKILLVFQKPVKNEEY